MRRVGRASAIAALGIWMMSIAAPAAAGGGGGGGVCHEEPPVLDAGWVSVGDSCFAPSDIEIGTGSAVRWKLVGQIAHTVTFDGGPDAGQIPPDGLAVQINSAGTYGYSCSLHPGMIGTIRAVGSEFGGPAIEVLGVSAISTSGGRTSVLSDSVPMRVEFSPLAAVIVLAVGLPLSLAAAARLVGVTHSPARYRLRAPWVSTEPPRPSARR